ncbi:MAG: glycine cleavage system protein H [Candidatus Hodarchaeales archaeon]
MTNTYEISGYKVPSSAFVTSDHMYFLPVEGVGKDEGLTFQCGLDDYIQQNIGRVRYIHFVEKAKQEFSKGETIFSVETEKWIGHSIAPFSLSVIQRNESLTNNPSLINEDCYDQGWIIKIYIEPESKSLLMNLYHNDSLVEWLKNEVEEEDKQ